MQRGAKKSGAIESPHHLITAGGFGGARVQP